MCTWYREACYNKTPYTLPCFPTQVSSWLFPVLFCTSILIWSLHSVFHQFFHSPFFPPPPPPSPYSSPHSSSPTPPPRRPRPPPVILLPLLLLHHHHHLQGIHCYMICEVCQNHHICNSTTSYCGFANPTYSLVSWFWILACQLCFFLHRHHSWQLASCMTLK